MIPENRKIPASTQIKGIEAIIDTRVPLQDPDNFTTLSGVSYFQNEFGRKITSNVTFERPSIYAGEFDETSKRVIAPIYTTLNISKTEGFHKNKADVWHTSETTVPPILAGSKPSWLILTGDSYLVGLDNLNILEMQYFERTKIASTYYEDIVVCNIIAITGGNSDLTANLLIDLDYDTNSDDSPVLANSVINASTVFGDFYTPNIAVPGDSVFADLGGGNHALIPFQTAGTSVSFVDRSEVQILVDAAYKSRIATEVTVIVRISAIDFSTANSRTLFSSFSANADGLGLRRGFRVTMTSTGRLVVRIARFDPLALNHSEFLANVTDTIPINSSMYVIGVTILVDGVNTTIKAWRKSAQDSIAFESVMDTTSAANALTLESTLDFSLDKLDVVTTTSTRPTGKNKLKVWDTVLTPAQVEAEMIALDNYIAP